MAKDKKSVLVYIDWIHIFEELEDSEAGVLIKHFFRYVNDQNPEPPDRLTKLIFEPIKQSLKRDLIKYEAIRIKNKENADKRWQDYNATASDRIPVDANYADSDSDSDNVIDKGKLNKFNFKKSLIELGVLESIVSDWLKVRSKKKCVNTEIAFESIKTQIELSRISANECIKKAVEKSWAGFEAQWIENLNNQNGTKINNRNNSTDKSESVASRVKTIKV